MSNITTKKKQADPSELGGNNESLPKKVKNFSDNDLDQLVSPIS